MSIIPPLITDLDMADRLGWSIKRVRNVARRAGACLLMGRTMLFEPGDIAVMVAISEGELDTPPPFEKKKYHDAFVYFFKQGDFVKIGWSRKWRQRLATLQRSTPNDIEVMAIYRGGIRMERGLHATFAEYRVRLEWFSDCDAIRAYVSSNKHKCCMDAKTKPPETIHRGTPKV